MSVDPAEVDVPGEVEDESVDPFVVDCVLLLEEAGSLVGSSAKVTAELWNPPGAQAASIAVTRVIARVFLIDHGFMPRPPR